MIESPISMPATLVEITIDGRPVSAPEGSTILEAAASVGVTVPTLCYLETLAPFNSVSYTHLTLPTNREV